MKRQTLILLTGLLTLLFGVGCASSGPDAVGSKKAKAVVPSGQQARVMVEGEDKGVTPATIRVKRSFGEMGVILYVNGTEVRRYEVERTKTVDGLSMAYSFWGDSDGRGVTFDASTLPTRKDGTYMIPFHTGSVSVEDRQYDLTLVIEN